MSTVREIRLRRRPKGLPSATDFEIASVALRDPGEGDVQVRNLWMSVDPYMRLRMNDAASYVEPFRVGEVMEGGAIGQVTASNASGFEVGDLVQSYLGWREGFTASASTLERLEPGELPPETFLGVAGMPGLTAYAGLLRVAALKPGDVVFVSGAAGAVGSVVCQIAKAKGNRVIGAAGGPEKSAFLEAIGVDHVIDYKAEPDLGAALAKAAPDGIDVYFENVGGAHLEAALDAARDFARFAICGMISSYNDQEAALGPRNLTQIVVRNIRMEGFIVTHHYDLLGQFRDEVAAWIREGKMTWKQTVFDGLERAPEAFLGLFAGRNFGKMLVKL